jgi:hypothetical protein
MFFTSQARLLREVCRTANQRVTRGKRSCGRVNEPRHVATLALIRHVREASIPRDRDAWTGQLTCDTRVSSSPNLAMR